MKTCALLLSLVLIACTIKVEPIPKPKPVVVHHYHTKAKHHRAAHPHATPHGMIEESEHTKLIEHPEPTP